MNWMVQLQDYEYDIAYIKGKTNQVADRLSRPYPEPEKVRFEPERILVPRTERVETEMAKITKKCEEILRRHHDHQSRGHPDAKRVINSLKREDEIWEGATEDVR